MNLKDKKILITGATGGIGHNLVKKFNELGSIVLATGTNVDKLDKFTAKVHEIIKDETTGLLAVFNNDGYPADNLYELFRYKVSIMYYYDKQHMDDILIEELNKLTESKNEEWSSYRIRYSLKEVLSTYPRSDLYNLDIDVVSSRIVEYIYNAGGNNPFDKEAPILYCNYIPTDCEENKEWPESSTYLYNMVYYNCERCDKINRGDPEDNKFICYNCHHDLNAI